MGSRPPGYYGERQRLHKLPIIAMTAHALVEERQRCLDAGMNDHVSKPIDPDRLLSTLLRWAKPRPQQARDPQSRSATEKSVRRSDSAGNRRHQSRGWPEARCAETGGSTATCWGSLPPNRPMQPLEISTALENGDHKLAERIAHTVKGVAGNIGITEVQSVAQKLEKALRDGEINVSAAAG